MTATRPGPPAASRAVTPPSPEAPPAPPVAPKHRSMVVPAMVVAVALVGAAFVMRTGRSGSPSSAGAAPTAKSTVAPAHDGDVVTLDPITMNLTGGDIVKVGIALQLGGPTGSSVAKKAIADPKNFGARALDELIAVLGSYTHDQLAQRDGLAAAKAKLTKRLGVVYHGDVVAVYFTQFVIA